MAACTGSDGINGLSFITTSTEESPGDNCANGGFVLQSGFDNNGNRKLDESEIDADNTQYLCNGADGETGARGMPGEQGDPGPAGAAGAAGKDGKAPIVSVVPDTSNSCGTAGGVAIISGYDLSDPADGDILDPGEAIGAPSYVCNGTDGANSGEVQLVAVLSETAGANCEAGGIRILTGFDQSEPLDGDILDPGEAVGQPQFVCNGVAGDEGQDGRTSLVVASTIAAGANCANGGVAIAVGYDLSTPPDGDILDAGEQVGATTYVCNGTNGTGAVPQRVSITPEVSGANCTNGGVRLQTYLDADSDGVLDAGEADGAPTYVCNGTSGGGGGGGATAVAASTEPAGANCASGGVRIQAGADANGNGVLDLAEINPASTTYACTDPTNFNGVRPVVVTSDVIGQAGITVPAGTNVTLQQATINVPGPGTVLAIATTKAYCDNVGAGPGFEYFCGAPWPDVYTLAHLTIHDAATPGPQPGNGGSAIAVYLLAGVDSVLTTTEVFTIAAAGSYTYVARGLPGTNDTDPGVAVFYDQTELTLVYIPN
jgi:hypothetical protein